MTQQGGHPEAAPGLQQRARTFADELLALPPRSPDFAAKIASITAMGEPDLRAAAALSDRFLQRDVDPLGVGPVGHSTGDAQGLVASALSRLRAVVTRLDPTGAGRGRLRGLLRRLPGSDALGDYVAGLTSEQDELDAVLVDLLAGQDGLRRDNAVIEVERGTARQVLERLGQYDELCARLEVLVDEGAARLEASGRPDDAALVRADALTAVRRRRVDLATAHAVALQGQLVLDVVRDTNLELIRGVDRAQRTTLVALRTAVSVAEASRRQTLLLDRISGLGGVVEAAVAPGASPADVGRVTTAFDEVLASLDAIDDLRVRARVSLEAGRR